MQWTRFLEGAVNAKVINLSGLQTNLTAYRTLQQTIKNNKVEGDRFI